MGISLTGLTPATTYDALIKVGDNGPIDATLKTLSDGLGNDLPMQASTTGINFTGALQQSGVAVPTASQVATKQATLVSGTNIKTVNSTTLLGSGDIAVQTPLVSGTSIKTVNSNSLLGAGDVAVQPTLVSGTNIKTLNSVSLLGSGDIVLAATPSGVSGAIQFSNGSAFASDAANFFWDNTNKRLGIGTNAPTQALDVIGAGRFYQSFAPGIPSLFAYNGRAEADSTLRLENSGGGKLYFGGFGLLNETNASFGQLSAPSARVHIKGSGSTSATTSLLVQNSAGTQALKIDDALGFQIGSLLSAGAGQSIRTDSGGGGINGGINTNFNNGATWIDDTNTRAMQIPYNGGVLFANTTRYPITIGAATKAVASAQLEMVSTTQGFLPPRGTNTQMNAIASPATGLVFYDTTNNKLCVYNATSWIPLH